MLAVEELGALAALSFAIGLAVLVDTLRRRLQIRKGMPVIATVERCTGKTGVVKLSWMWMGQGMISMPLVRMYLIKNKVQLPIIIRMDTGSLVCIDTWTQNCKGRYLVSLGFILIGLTALVLQFTRLIW